MRLPMNDGPFVGLSLAFLIFCGACGSVEVGQDHYYRLGQASLKDPQIASRGHLRIEDFTLSPHLGGDQLLVQQGESEIYPYRYHYWAAPLDRMVTDSVYRAFLDSNRFETVLDATDPGKANWVLSGRILEFQEVRGSQAARGRVRLACTLRSEPGGLTLWQGEVEEEVLSKGDTAVAVVQALDKALGKALERIALRAEERMQVGASTASPPR